MKSCENLEIKFVCGKKYHTSWRAQLKKEEQRNNADVIKRRGARDVFQRSKCSGIRPYLDKQVRTIVIQLYIRLRLIVRTKFVIFEQNIGHFLL
jgi:hypothetical protein